MPAQCHRKELACNGKGLLENIKNNLSKYAGMACNVDLDSDIELLNKLGIDKDNVYLHVRGHNLFDMVSYIGKLLVKRSNMSFYKDVLTANVPSGYWQISNVDNDINSILG